MVDAFSRNKKIKYISVAHEQGAAMMADAYSRLDQIILVQWLLQVLGYKLTNWYSLFLF